MRIYNEYINFQDEHIIKLDSNELYLETNYNILMKIKSCLTTINMYRYPNNEMKNIKELYAKYAKTYSRNIIVGNGSNEALELAIGSIISNGKKALTIGPDFEMYDFFVSKFNGEIEKYQINESMKFDVNEFIKVGEEKEVDLIVFSNPNNPTGIGMEIEDIIKILEKFKNITVIVDEAYYEFYGKSMIGYINKYKNLIITRTLSKAWGLAALRVGFLISHEENIDRLLNKKVPYSINLFSQNLAEIALKSPENVIDNVKQVICQREKFYENLKLIEENAAMNIKFYQSHGNFIYGKTFHKEALINGLKSNRILIRNFNDDTFRITVGSPMENRKVVETIKKIFVY